MKQLEQSGIHPNMCDNSFDPDAITIQTW